MIFITSKILQLELLNKCSGKIADLLIEDKVLFTETFLKQPNRVAFAARVLGLSPGWWTTGQSGCLGSKPQS